MRIRVTEASRCRDALFVDGNRAVNTCRDKDKRKRRWRHSRVSRSSQMDPGAAKHKPKRIEFQNIDVVVT